MSTSECSPTSNYTRVVTLSRVTVGVVKGLRRVLTVEGFVNHSSNVMFTESGRLNLPDRTHKLYETPVQSR